jgi:hypothetical protein
MFAIKAFGPTALIVLIACSCHSKAKNSIAPAPTVVVGGMEDAGLNSKLKRQLAASIAAFKNRKRYARLTPEILAKIPDADVEQVIVDFIECRAEREGQDDQRALAHLPSGFLPIYATWLLEAEVNNGGFNQFFWNSSGQFAADALAGFRAIGAAEHARLTERAINIYKSERVRLEKFKQRGSLEDFSESYKDNKLNALDDEFFKSGIDLSKLRVGFIRANPKLFEAQCETG